MCFTGQSNLSADSLEKERGLVSRRRKRKWFFSSSDCPLMFPLNVMNEKLKKDTECMSVYFTFFKLLYEAIMGPYESTAEENLTNVCNVRGVPIEVNKCTLRRLS